MKAVAVTKMIRRDLEVAAEFDIKGLPSSELLHRLADTGHIRVVLPHNDNYVVFVPRNVFFFVFSFVLALPLFISLYLARFTTRAQRLST